MKPPGLLTVQRPIREEVYDRVRADIVLGRLKPGAPVRDTDVARGLGVSRTPVREALLRLNRDGFLDLSHNRGFRVPVLDMREALETYPILWALEVEALRAAAATINTSLPELRELNSRFARPGRTPLHHREIDEDWHRALLEPSGNVRLLDLLAIQKQVIKRYELQFMRDRSRVQNSAQEHADILECLERGAVEEACRRLEQHWRRGMEIVVRGMAAQ